MSGSRGKLFQEDLNMISLVLVLFKDDLLLRSHSTENFNSWLMTGFIV